MWKVFWLHTSKNNGIHFVCVCVCVCVWKVFWLHTSGNNGHRFVSVEGRFSDYTHLKKMGQRFFCEEGRFPGYTFNNNGNRLLFGRFFYIFFRRGVGGGVGFWLHKHCKQ